MTTSQVQLNRLDFPDREIGILPTGDWHGFRSHACEKEPETVEWIRSFEPESVFWDIGASVGPYSLIAAALGHTVYAFEPNGPSYGELCQNILINSIDVTPFPVAVSTGERIQKQYVHTWGAGAGSHSFQKKFERSVPVLCYTADEIADSTGMPDYVKIDVDGGEIEVIESGRSVWENVRSMMIEVSRGTKDHIGLVLSASGLIEHERTPRVASGEFNYLYVRED